jgi:hypothetical protein
MSTVGRNLDATTLRLQYLETLKDVGTASSTKIVVPMELGGLVSGILGQLSPQPSGAAENGHAGLHSGPPSPAPGGPAELEDSETS